MLCNTPTLNTSKTNILFITPYLRKASLAISFTLNHAIIHPSSIARHLRVLLDDKLKFDAHKPVLTFFESKLSWSVGINSRPSPYLPTKTLLTSYYSSEHAHLLYSLPIRASTYDTCLIEIHRLQNKAIRILTKCRVSNHITLRFHNLRMLKVNDTVINEIAKFMHQQFNILIKNHLNTLITISCICPKYTHIQPEIMWQIKSLYLDSPQVVCENCLNL